MSGGFVGGGGGSRREKDTRGGLEKRLGGHFEA